MLSFAFADHHASPFNGKDLKGWSTKKKAKGKGRHRDGKHVRIVVPGQSAIIVTMSDSGQAGGKETPERTAIETTDQHKRNTDQACDPNGKFQKQFLDRPTVRKGFEQKIGQVSNCPVRVDAGNKMIILMPVVEGFLYDAAKVKTVMRIWQSHPISNHLWPEKLLLPFFRNIVSLGKVYPSISDPHAQAVGQEDEKQSNDPMRPIFGQFQFAGEKTTLGKGTFYFRIGIS